MTRGLFTASVAVTAALTIGPASSGRMSPRSSHSAASNKAAERPVTPAPDVSRAVSDVPSTVAPADDLGPSLDVIDRPMLTMLQRNPKLQSRLGELLPPGMSVREAAAGFVDPGQFVSAVHVSRNLGIPFSQLKAKIVDEQMSLGQAIQSLRPDADVWQELTRVRDLASRDLY
jgi:hypothetical protein